MLLCHTPLFSFRLSGISWCSFGHAQSRHYAPAMSRSPRFPDLVSPISKKSLAKWPFQMGSAAGSDALILLILDRSKPLNFRTKRRTRNARLLEFMGGLLRCHCFGAYEVICRNCGLLCRNKQAAIPILRHQLAKWPILRHKKTTRNTRLLEFLGGLLQSELPWAKWPFQISAERTRGGYVEIAPCFVDTNKLLCRN